RAITDSFVVGDSVWDMLAAQRAQARGIRVLSRGYGREELETAGAYRRYDDPLDLLEHLDELGIRTRYLAKLPRSPVPDTLIGGCAGPARDSTGGAENEELSSCPAGCCRHCFRGRGRDRAVAWRLWRIDAGLHGRQRRGVRRRAVDRVRQLGPA